MAVPRTINQAQTYGSKVKSYKGNHYATKDLKDTKSKISTIIDHPTIQPGNIMPRDLANRLSHIHPKDRQSYLEELEYFLVERKKTHEINISELKNDTTKGHEYRKQDLKTKISKTKILQNQIFEIAKKYNIRLNGNPRKADGKDYDYLYQNKETGEYTHPNYNKTVLELNKNSNQQITTPNKKLEKEAEKTRKALRKEATKVSLEYYNLASSSIAKGEKGIPKILEILNQNIKKLKKLQVLETKTYPNYQLNPDSPINLSLLSLKNLSKSLKSKSADKRTTALAKLQRKSEQGRKYFKENDLETNLQKIVNKFNNSVNLKPQDFIRNARELDRFVTKKIKELKNDPSILNSNNFSKVRTVKEQIRRLESIKSVLKTISNSKGSQALAVAKQFSSQLDELAALKPQRKADLSTQKARNQKLDGIEANISREAAIARLERELGDGKGMNASIVNPKLNQHIPSTVQTIKLDDFKKRAEKLDDSSVSEFYIGNKNPKTKTNKFTKLFGGIFGKAA